MLAACGGDVGGRAAPLDTDVLCGSSADPSCEDAGEVGSGGSPGQGDDAGAVDTCLPKTPGRSPRGEPLRATVVMLDDPLPHLGAGVLFQNTEPLVGKVRVEVEKPGCGLASALTDPDGNFEVEGAANGEVFYRFVPVDSPHLTTTISRASVNGVPYPILTRAAVDGMFAATAPALFPDPERGHVAVTFLSPGTPPAPYSGGTIDGTSWTVGYDGALTTGAKGLGVLLNAEVGPYPGTRIDVTGVLGNGSDVTQSVPVAEDAVTFVLVQAG